MFNKRLSQLLMTLILFTGGFWLLAHCWLNPPQIFVVQEVILQGTTSHLEPKELVRLAGIQKGDHLFKIRLAEIERRLTQKKWIKQIALTKRFPGKIYLRVEEYSPIVILRLDKTYYVDSEGVIFKALEAEDSLQYPEITGLDVERFQKAPRWAQSEMDRALEIFYTYQYSPIYKFYGLSEIHFEDNNVVLYSDHPCIRIELGNSAHMEKLAKLAKGIEEIYKYPKMPVRFDLSQRGKIIVKYEREEKRWDAKMT